MPTQILFATGSVDFERAVIEELNRKTGQGKYLSVFSVTHLDNIEQMCVRLRPQIVIVRDTIVSPGQDFLELIRHLKMTITGLRIIILTKSRLPGDPLMTGLMMFGVYDVLARDEFSVNDVVHLVLHPRTMQDMSAYIPNATLKNDASELSFSASDDARHLEQNAEASLDDIEDDTPVNVVQSETVNHTEGLTDVDKDEKSTLYTEEGPSGPVTVRRGMKLGYKPLFITASDNQEHTSRPEPHYQTSSPVQKQHEKLHEQSSPAKKQSAPAKPTRSPVQKQNTGTTGQSKTNEQKPQPHVQNNESTKSGNKENTIQNSHVQPVNQKQDNKKTADSKSRASVIVDTPVQKNNKVSHCESAGVSKAPPAHSSGTSERETHVQTNGNPREKKGKHMNDDIKAAMQERLRGLPTENIQQKTNNQNDPTARLKAMAQSSSNDVLSHLQQAVDTPQTSPAQDDPTARLMAMARGAEGVDKEVMAHLTPEESQPEKAPVQQQSKAAHDTVQQSNVPPIPQQTNTSPAHHQSIAEQDMKPAQQQTSALQSKEPSQPTVQPNSNTKTTVQQHNTLKNDIEEDIAPAQQDIHVQTSAQPNNAQKTALKPQSSETTDSDSLSILHGGKTPNRPSTRDARQEYTRPSAIKNLFGGADAGGAQETPHVRKHSTENTSTQQPNTDYLSLFNTEDLKAFQNILKQIVLRHSEELLEAATGDEILGGDQEAFNALLQMYRKVNNLIRKADSR